MKNKLTKIIPVLTLVGLMFAGPLAYAVPQGDDPERGQDPRAGRKPMQGPMVGLNLTPSQQEEFMALQNSSQEEKSKAVTEQLNIKSQALNAAIAEPGTTLTDVSDIIDEMAELQAKKLSMSTEHLFALKKILTPEQFEQMRKQNSFDGKMGQKNQGPGGPEGENPGSEQG
jgi:Spy/CpxP family protein refolding chaperone